MLSTTAERIWTKLSCNEQFSRDCILRQKILALELNEKKGRPTGSFNEKPFFETSAKSGENVQKVFDFILNTCLPLDDEETAKRSLRQSMDIDLENKSQTQSESTKKCY